jgi:hypothetical protein
VELPLFCDIDRLFSGTSRMATSAFGSFYFTTWRLESLRTPVSRSKRKKQVYGGLAEI